MPSLNALLVPLAVAASSVTALSVFYLMKVIHEEEEQPFDLPPGWKRRRSRKHNGRYYYVNEALNHRQWERPKPSPPVLRDVKPASQWSDLPGGDGTSRGKVILIRHGQSMWNRDPHNPERLWRYGGSCDVPLSAKGVTEAVEAGEQLKNLPIDLVFISEMDRAKTTAMLMLMNHLSRKTPLIQHGCDPLEAPKFSGFHGSDPHSYIFPVYVAAELNERNFGVYQGLPNTEHTKLLRKEELKKVRNDFNTPFPEGESSRDVAQRTIPWFVKTVVPHLAAGRNVLISSHGFAIRTIIKYLDGMSDEEWNEQMSIEKSRPADCLLLAPTGVPLIYTYSDGTFVKQVQSRVDRQRSVSRSSAAY